jgi:ferric enterobactin receptor
MKIFLLGLCLLCGMVAHAQNTVQITGRVVDSATHRPVEYATVTIADGVTKKMLNGAMSDSTGFFEISGLHVGECVVNIESMDYMKKTVDHVVIGGERSTQSLGTIVLSPGGHVLKSVTITGGAPIIENKIDKMVYNAANDVTSQGGQALDVLKKVPQVNVDIDGNVELQGNPNVRFLINGKPSSIFGSSVTDALASIPASQIKSIEVITSPGARYDAQGTGGIINIVLKESKMQGLNGTINLSGGSRLENGSFNLNYRHNHVGVNAFFSGNAQLVSHTPSTQTRSSFDSLGNTVNKLLQDGYTDFSRNGYQTGVGLDWDISKRDNITAAASYNHFGNVSRGFISVEQDSATPANSVRNSYNHFMTGSIDWSANYKRKFRTDGDELNILYNGSFGAPTTYYQQTNIERGAAVPYAGSESNNPGTNQEHDFSVNYTKAIKEHFVLDAGTKLTRQDITSAAEIYDLTPGAETFVPDPYRSYDLKYHLQVYAAYLSASFPIGSFLKVNAGARYEYTETQIDYQHTTIPAYGILVPSMILSHDFQNGQFIKLSYTRRIERADYRDVNPFFNFADPYNVTTGNPLLKPEIGNNMELGYNKSFGKGSNIYIALIERINTQDHKTVTTYYDNYTVGDTTYRNISVASAQNLGTEFNTGVNVSGSWTIKDKLNLRANLFYTHRHSTVLPPGSSGSDGDRFRTNANASYQFSKTLVAEIFGNYNSATNNIQGRTPQSVTYTIALRKQFWSKKASIGLTATNLFNEYTRQVITVQAADYSSYTVREIPYRSVGINFIYNFGKLEFKKAKGDTYENSLPGMDN